ncbi:hypothetical protein A2U01_0105950, partial [Trifolium medium]|nr:hypothetical protein [Trifolium medium]
SASPPFKAAGAVLSSSVWWLVVPSVRSKWIVASKELGFTALF